MSLADDLECRAADDLSLCVEPALPFPVADNLALRAAALLRTAAGVEAGAALRLWKRIPVAAGLGGGSADAAAALAGLARLWGLRGVALAPLAERLGSDVPFFLHSATALVEGRGEVVTPLPAPAARSLVLLRPRAPLATQAVFAALRPAEWTDGGQTRRLAEALRAGASLDESVLMNGLLAAAERCCPPLAHLRAVLRAEGLRPHLSGTGPTLFLFTDDRAERRAILALARRLDAEAWPCRTLRARPLRLRALAPGGNERTGPAVEEGARDAAGAV